MKRPKKNAKKTSRYPGQAPGKDGHVSYAVAGCACLQCATHRRYDVRAEIDHDLAQRFENEPMLSEPIWYVHQRGETP